MFFTFTHDLPDGEQCEGEVTVTVQTVREEWGRTTYVEDVPDRCSECSHVYTAADVKEIEQQARDRAREEREESHARRRHGDW